MRQDNNSDSPTDYPGNNSYNGEQPTQYPGGSAAAANQTNDKTDIYSPKENLILGRLCLVGTDRFFQLKGQGRITVGRKANGSNAEMQIDCPNHRMSRDHLYIEVRKLPVKGYEHTVSLCKEKENPTYIGKERMVFGDKFILKDGDVISLPGLDTQHFIQLRFEIPDPEKTETAD
ncbi:MAG: FHA domain-containing protein [Prevotellaceae bacterium]|nr:FHA domain-containing protein [Prevotellaceae bacterium]